MTFLLNDVARILHWLATGLMNILVYLPEAKPRKTQTIGNAPAVFPGRAE
jgi:hypothetical protein